eukprot:503239_1
MTRSTYYYISGSIVNEKSPVWQSFFRKYYKYEQFKKVKAITHKISSILIKLREMKKRNARFFESESNYYVSLLTAELKALKNDKSEPSQQHQYVSCWNCGMINRKIMINRVFYYVDTLANCRLCGATVNKLIYGNVKRKYFYKMNRINPENTSSETKSEAFKQSKESEEKNMLLLHSGGIFMRYESLEPGYESLIEEIIKFGEMNLYQLMNCLNEAKNQISTFNICKTN